MTDNITFSPAAGTQIGGAHPDFNNWLVEVNQREGEGDAIIYGAADSSCSRSLWLIRELEHRNALKIKHVPILSPRQYNAETDKINPHRKMPFLDDKGTYLFESMAINLYLVKKYGSETDLAAKNLQEEASFLKWSIWASNELFMPVWELIICGPARVDTNHPWYTHPVVRNPDTPNKRGLTGEQRYFNLFSHPRSAMREAKLTSDFIRKMTALEKELQGKTYLVGERFTVCDLNICAYLAWVRHLGEDALRPFPNIKNWLYRCSFDRPTSPQYKVNIYNGPWRMFKSDDVVAEIRAQL